MKNNFPMKQTDGYWVNKDSGAFIGNFEGMYSEIDDPWGCARNVDSLNNQLFLDILFYKKKFNRVLDIGSGLGSLTNLMKQRNQGGNFVGIDVSETAVLKASCKFKDITFMRRDITVDDVRDLGEFDCVVLSEVLWYILGNLDSLFCRIAGLLVKNGTLAIHQYFPACQRYFKDKLDGIGDFHLFMEKNSNFSSNTLVEAKNSDGCVLLGLYTKRG